MIVRPSNQRPLVVDLDGTLIRSDLLIETIFGFLGQSPLKAFKLPLWLVRGRAVLKRRLSEIVDIDVKTLPYDDAVLARIHAARTKGHHVYLASASDEHLVQAIAAHLGLFDGWFGSDGVTNLSRTVKAVRLVEEFGEQNFDYIGSGRADLPVWKHAATAIIVGSSLRIERRLTALKGPIERITVEKKPNSWLRLLRCHQWAKNALVGVPLLTAHQFSPTAFLLALLAAIAFSACASSVYILNDLVDIQADRGHPSKRNRPFASGDISFATGAVLGLICLVFAFGVAAFISREFLIVLSTYFIGTTAYSLLLKRKMMIDAVTLAGLYTIRIVGGAAAIGVPMSEWLIAFSMFIFISLAFVKRYSEMALRFDTGLPDPTNRNYKAGDLPIIASMAAASGYCAVIVFSLYLSSDSVRALYAHPHILWLVCPLLLYWISRMLMLSHRRLVNDDPIIFAIKDKVSWAVTALIVLIGALADAGA